MIRETLLGIAGVWILGYGLELIFGYYDDPREPRRVASSIPIFGHLFGLLWYGFEYHEIVGRSTDAEIFTIGILHYKVYVTTASRLTHMVQRTKALSTKPFLRNESKIHANISGEAHALFDGSLLENFRLCTKKAFAAGPSLDALTLRLGQQALIAIADVAKKDEFMLLEWVKHIVVPITAVTLFGEHHPLEPPEITEANWIWEDFKVLHHMGIDLTGRGYRARTKVFNAFRKYFNNMPADVSLIIKNRQTVLREGGMSEEDVLGMQAYFSDAYYNIVPTMFWTIYNVFSRPQLLEAIREEVSINAVQKPNDGSSVLDMAALKTACPLLLSTYQETQRTRHAHATSRSVVEDTFLDQYLLKKGNILQMPVRPIHESREIWGDSANVLDPYRFMPAVNGEVSKPKILPHTFLPWGVAPYICPARQFVSTEVLTVVALLALQVDLMPIASEKGWEQDPAVRSLEKPTLARPKKDVRVRLGVRETSSTSWTIVVGQSNTRLNLASG